MDRERYILTTGEKGEAQLDALDRTFGVESRKFLQRLDIANRRQIADIGCGSGNLSLWMAQQIASSQGKVIGVDNSEEQVRVAQRRAEEQGIHNVEFVVLSAYDLSSLPKNFDLVYCRWLLVHLDDPIKAIQQMAERITKGGVLACEETTGYKISYPHHEFISTLWKWLYNVLIAKGCDIEIGLHLFQIMQSFKHFQPALQFNQIVVTDHDEIRDFFNRLKILLISTTPALLHYKQASSEQIEALLKQFENAEPQPGDLIAYDCMAQLSAKRIL